MAGFLDGKVALVTGTAVGIGNAYARALAANGARVAMCDIRANELSRLAGQMLMAGHDVLALDGDVADPGDVRRIVDATLDRFGQVDILINNAGYSPVTLVTEPLAKGVLDWQRVVGTNTKGTYLFGRALIPHMIARGSGEIVNIITDHSWNCGSPYFVDHTDAQACRWKDAPRPTGSGPTLGVYEASKWAAFGLTLTWAKALRPHGIRVNGICMGATDTPLIREYFDWNPPAEYLSTWMTCEAVAEVVMDLLREGPTGRNGDFIGLWAGHPTVLPPPSTEFTATH
jgi:NAD(P)-dependent dehydrogenase (short-subunit alcohol dehydrogenase family)